MTSFPHVAAFEAELIRQAPYMSATVQRARDRFGETWQARFDETLDRIFGGDAKRLEDATNGYIRFALDATKLQKIFEKELTYRAKTYAEAAAEVYHNRDYMESLYLPGILLSHYLWPHHYQQLCYFHERFAPLMTAAADKNFCDVGVGSGFYSRQALGLARDVTGSAFDISEHSIAYAKFQISRFGFSDRWSIENRDVIANTPGRQWPFLISVEVLEHLEDPVAFLRALRRMLAKGGRGFITAAITAPNADHIFLYRNCQDVIAQIEQAGFELIDYREDIAYEPKRDEPVPRLGAFIVT